MPPEVAVACPSSLLVLEKLLEQQTARKVVMPRDFSTAPPTLLSMHSGIFSNHSLIVSPFPPTLLLNMIDGLSKFSTVQRGNFQTTIVCDKRMEWPNGSRCFFVSLHSFSTLQGVKCSLTIPADLDTKTSSLPKSL